VRISKTSKSYLKITYFSASVDKKKSKTDIN